MAAEPMCWSCDAGPADPVAAERFPLHREHTYVYFVLGDYRSGTNRLIDIPRCPSCHAAQRRSRAVDTWTLWLLLVLPVPILCGAVSTIGAFAAHSRAGGVILLLVTAMLIALMVVLQRIGRRAGAHVRRVHLRDLQFPPVRDALADGWQPGGIKR